ARGVYSQHTRCTRRGADAGGGGCSRGGGKQSQQVPATGNGGMSELWSAIQRTSRRSTHCLVRREGGQQADGGPQLTQGPGGTGAHEGANQGKQYSGARAI